VFKNNIIINYLIIGNLLIPKYFNNKIMEYKALNDNYYKYIIILTINDEIEKKYHIDMLSIGMNLYDKYKTIMNRDDDKLSDISNLSDMSDLSDIDDN
jgi:hypothetical protein